MKLKCIVLCLSLFAAFAISFNAYAGEKAKSKKMSNSEKAKMILNKALSNRTSYSAMEELHRSANDQRKCYKYVRYNLDGTVETRTDFVTFSNKAGKEKRRRIKIRNGNGEWSIYDNIGIHERPKNEVQVDLKGEDHTVKLKYSVKDSVLKKIPCYKVREEEINPALTDDDIKIVEYEIGKNNFFLYSTTQYSKNGKKKGSMSNCNVKFNPKFKKNLFKVPDNCKIFNVKNVDDYIRLTGLANDMQLMKDPEVGKMIKEFYLDEYGTDDVLEILSTNEGGKDEVK